MLGLKTANCCNILQSMNKDYRSQSYVQKTCKLEGRLVYIIINKREHVNDKLRGSFVKICLKPELLLNLQSSHTHTLMHQKLLSYNTCRFPVVQRCWNILPEERPTFGTLVILLQDYRDEQELYI